MFKVSYYKYSNLIMNVFQYRKYIIEPNNYDNILVNITDNQSNLNYIINSNYRCSGYKIYYDESYYIYPTFQNTRHILDLNLLNNHITKTLKKFSDKKRKQISEILKEKLLDDNINIILLYFN